MRPALVPKSEPTYRLAPQYRPLPGERIDGDGATMAPFMERIHERKLAILMEHGPPRRARGPDGRFLPDSDPWPMLTLVLLAVAGSFRPGDDELTFDRLAAYTALPAPELRTHLEFWVRHGLIVC